MAVGKGIAFTPPTIYERISIHFTRANNIETVISGRDWPTLFADCCMVATSGSQNFLGNANPASTAPPTFAPPGGMMTNAGGGGGGGGTGRRTVTLATRRKLALASKQRWEAKRAAALAAGGGAPAIPPSHRRTAAKTATATG